MINDIFETVKSIMVSFKNDILNHIIIEELSYLDKLNQDIWAISIKGKNKFRIHFGPFIIFTIEPQKIWLSLDNNEYQNNISLIKSTKVWSIDANDYPQYKQYGLFSQNGYISNEISKEKNEWEILKKYHFIFLEKISRQKFQLDVRTKKNHSLELNLYLKLLLSDDIPIPSYLEQNDFIEDNIGYVYEKEKSDIKKVSYEKTETLSYVTVRLGQHIFRKNLLSIYDSCILCGIKNTSLLKASHIKPWSKSSNIEKLDPSNGLLLCANHDALFDSGLISFNDNGYLLISEQISNDDRQKLYLIEDKYGFDIETQLYIKWHRDNIFNVNSDI